MSQLMHTPQQSNRGISSLELIVIITVLMAALTIAIPLFLNTHDINREIITRKKLNAIKNAILGDPSLYERSERCSFGFIGDLGVPPNNLNELIQRDPARPLYQPAAINPSLFFGWHGPYLNNQVGRDINNQSTYTALLDAWGRVFVYQLDTDGDTATWDPEIRSLGANGIEDDDDIFIIISDSEIRTPVLGDFTDSSHHPIEESLVTVYYPNGTTLVPLEITPDSANRTHYDSRINTVNPANTRSIPIGNRYMITGTFDIQKIVALSQRRPFSSDNDCSIVNFVAPNVTPTEPEFERNFYATDNTDPLTGNPIITLMGNWQTDNNGNFWANGGYQEYRAVFGNAGWQDYRIEVDATLYEGRGYGIYYRSNGRANISGYCFQYDPGWTSGGRVAFLVRKVVDGAEQNPFQSVVMSTTSFPNVYNASHHTSITVRGTRHIIKVDGNPVFGTYGFDDSTFMVGQPGLRSWDGSHFTNFHHLRVHGIPPLSTKEFVWWSFEEGGGSTVYGSCFLIDAPEINGTINNLTTMYRRWQSTNIHGQALYSNGSSSAFLNFGDVLDIIPTDAFSISAWIRIDSINTNNQYVIISKIQQGNQRGWKLYLDQSSSYNFGVRFALQQTSSSQLLIRHNNLQITAGRWFHVLVTYNGTGASGTMDPAVLNIYVTPFENNSMQTNPTLITIDSGLRSSSNTDNSGSMLIGAELTGSNPFNGSIDEVRFFRSVLNATERDRIFQKEK